MHRPAPSTADRSPAPAEQERRATATPQLHCDLRRRITATNSAAEHLIGRSGADMQGALVESLSPPGAQARTAAELASLMYERPGTRGTVEFDGADHDGGRLLLEVSCRPRPDNDGYVIELRRPTVRPEAAPLLSERELEVFVRVAAGKTGAEIAGELFLAPTTVERHVANVLRKLGARNRPHGVALALRANAFDEAREADPPPLEALRETVETLEDPAALLTIDGTVLVVNGAWRAFERKNGRVGIPLEQNYLRVCELAASDDDAARAAAGLREVLEDRLESFSMEYRCDAPDHPRWFGFHATRHRRTDGAAVLVRHRDLTPQRLAEQQADLGAAFLDGVEAATFVYAPDGTVTAWMAGAERLLGWTAAEAVGRPVWELFLGRRNWPTGRAIVAAVGTAGRWSGELEFERRDGSTFYGHVRDRLVRLPDGDAPGKVVGVVTDVSARRNAEREAAAATRALRELSETMRDGWIAIDADRRIVRVNGATLRMLGWEQHELVGHGLDEFLAARTPDRATPRRGAAGTEDEVGPPAVHREGLRTRDGRTLLVDFIATRTSAPGDPDVHGAAPCTGWSIVFWSARDAALPTGGGPDA